MPAYARHVAHKHATVVEGDLLRLVRVVSSADHLHGHTKAIAHVSDERPAHLLDVDVGLVVLVGGCETIKTRKSQNKENHKNKKITKQDDQK